MDASDAAALLLQLDILRAVEGTSSVSSFGVEGTGKLNSYGVFLKVQLDSTQRAVHKIRVPCSAEQPTKLDCAIEAKRRVAVIVGADRIEQAERAVMKKRAAADNCATPRYGG